MLIQQLPQVWSPSAVHDTVAAVARGLAFRRDLRQSIGDRLLMWIGNAISEFISFLRQSSAARPIGFAVVAVIVGLAVILIVAQLVVAARARDATIAAGGRRGRSAVDDDPFLSADQLARDGRYEEAAHALYRGVLLALAQRERMRLDPSRTSGDYARELRARSSPSYQNFRAFARRFDRAVYGRGGCDAALIDDLRQLAVSFSVRARAA